MRIAILGYGIEGKSVHRYFTRTNPTCEIDVFDQKQIPDDQITVQQVASFLDIDFSPYDTIIRSPSVSPLILLPKITADKNGQPFNFTTATQIFFDNCSAPIIGVTGTKGKGTTCSMIKSILDASPHNAYLVGNIGTPALDVLDEIIPTDQIVFELSSFQLWDLKSSPTTAVVLPVAIDHLDVHDGVADYHQAKSHIAEYQSPTDLIVFYPDNFTSQQIADKSPAKKQPYPSQSGAYIRDNSFYLAEHKICSADTLKLPGAHNIENALAAISAVWPLINDPAVIAAGISNFTGLPHRIELVRELRGVKYYDDSFASATPALEVAVKSFSTPTILIAGGFDRGLDYAPLGQFLTAQPNLKKIILIGQTRQQIADTLPENLYVFADTLQDAVDLASQLAEQGDTVLLSPGCASFDMFRDFVDRGDQFQQIVRSLS